MESWHIYNKSKTVFWVMIIRVQAYSSCIPLICPYTPLIQETYLYWPESTISHKLVWWRITSRGANQLISKGGVGFFITSKLFIFLCSATYQIIFFQASHNHFIFLTENQNDPWILNCWPLTVVSQSKTVIVCNIGTYSQVTICNQV